jgi:hypothetical protein
MEVRLVGYVRSMAAALLLLVFLAGGRPAPAAGPVGVFATAAPAWPAQGPSPLPTPQVPEAVQQLEQQAQQQLDQLSAQAKSKIGEETSRLEADAKQQAARQAGNVVKDFTARLQQALLNLVAQVCGASPAAVLLGALGLFFATRAARRR